MGRNTIQNFLVLICLLFLVSLAACNGAEETGEIENEKAEKKVSTIELPSSKYHNQRLVKEKEVVIDYISSGFPIISKIDCPDKLIVQTMDPANNELFLTFQLPGLEMTTERKIKRGEGPDECLSISVVGGSCDSLYVYDSMLRRYYLYNEKMTGRTYLNASTYETSWMPHNANFSSKENLFLIGFYKVINGITHRITDYHLYAKRINGNKIESQELLNIKSPFSNKENKTIFSRPIYFRLIDGYVYILQPDKYRLIKMDTHGNTLKEVQVTGLKSTNFSKREIAKWLKEAGMNYPRLTFPDYLIHAGWLVEFGEGFIVGRVEDYQLKEKEWGEADYFDKDLNYLGKIKIPWLRAWNFPSSHEPDVFYHWKKDRFYYIQRRDNGDDEDYWLTCWKLESQSK